MKRKWKKYVAILLAILIIAPSKLVSATVAKEDVQNPKLVKSFCSTYADSKMYQKEYYKITMKDQKMIVSGKTMETYANFWVYVRNSNGRYVFNQNESGGVPGSDRKFSKTLDISELDGNYIVLIKFIKNAEDSYEKNKVQMKGVPIKVKSGIGYILQYQSIVNENQKIRSTNTGYPEAYLDTSLSDMSYELRNGAKWTSTAKKKLTSYEQKKLKEFSNKIVGNAATKYEKLLRIHDYITQNVYYDRPFFEDSSVTGTLNPYDLYKQITSKTKKAKTVCNGYSVLFAALVRMQGIPCRTAKGHAISIPGNQWETESNLAKMDHVWNEAFVDGKWIVIDVTRDSPNVYYKNSEYPDGAYVRPEHEVKSYSGFDPSAPMLAVTHLYFGYREKISVPKIPKVKLTSVKKSGKKVIVKWKKSSGIKTYKIYRSTKPNGTYIYKGTKTNSSSTITFYDSKSLVKGKKYYYKVKGVKGKYSGPMSAYRSVSY